MEIEHEQDRDFNHSQAFRGLGRPLARGNLRLARASNGGAGVNTMRVSWFSAGVSSAVATKLAIADIDKIIYQHIDDQDEDTLRFVTDCEAWFGKPIEIIQSPLKTVEAACRYRHYVAGPTGAACTRMLKRELRKEWEYQNLFFAWPAYVWGFDVNEQDRADQRKREMPDCRHRFPLIENGLTKSNAHGLLAAAGIRRPKMYDLGFPNNNCVGCVKGGKAYWNLIRRLRPDVFWQRAIMEREIGGSCINGVYLDELDPNAGRGQPIIVPECGAACELLAEATA